MGSGEVRLGIDCGSASTVAVLVWPDGRWVPLLFDGAQQMPSAVHVGADGTLATGTLRRTPTGFDVLATVDAPDAGGLRIDKALADRVAALVGALAVGSSPAPLSDGERLMLLANVRAAKETLTHSVSVAVALPAPRPAVVLDIAQLEAVARPVLVQAAQTARRAIDAAEIDAGQLAGVYCIGGAATPLAVRVLGEETGLTPVAVDQPQLAATLGAAQATGRTGPAADAAPAPPPLPQLRRAFALLVPGAASLALVGHFIASAELNRTRSRGFPDPNAYVLANWGELAMAATFALIVGLAAATLIASTLPAQHANPARGGPGQASQQIGSGLLAAAAAGLAVAGLYAIGASVYFDLPTGAFLRWALLPVLPIAAAALITAVLAARWGTAPPEGWHAWLNFPVGSVLCAAVGMVLVQVSMTAHVYPSGALLNDLVGRGGALLLGVGAAFALVRPLRYRIIIAAPLAVFAAAIVSWPATGILAVIYIAAVTVWWAWQVWRLARARRPPPMPAG